MKRITIQILSIKVDERYYSFKYHIWVDGKLKIKNKMYESDHVWGNSEKEMDDFKKLLTQSEAYELALEQSMDEIF